MTLGEVTARHRFDSARLCTYLERHLAGFQGPIEVKQFQGGQSNPTYLLMTPSVNYVMRSKPGPTAKLLASAHAIEREFRVMTALADHGIPVPQTHLVVEDESVIGRAFFLMQHVEGRIFWEQSLPEAEPAERAEIYDEMTRIIALGRCRRRGPLGLREGRQLFRAPDQPMEQAVPSVGNPIDRVDEPADRVAAGTHSSGR
jgi:aminoglycoside phosphotransferase (APT) family kinase protein